MILETGDKFVLHYCMESHFRIAHELNLEFKQHAKNLAAQMFTVGCRTSLALIISADVGFAIF